MWDLEKAPHIQTPFDHRCRHLVVSIRHERSKKVIYIIIIYIYIYIYIKHTLTLVLAISI